MSYPSVNLPRRAPLLSRAGWAAFFTALDERLVAQGYHPRSP